MINKWLKCVLFPILFYLFSSQVAIANVGTTLFGIATAGAGPLLFSLFETPPPNATPKEVTTMRNFSATQISQEALDQTQVGRTAESHETTSESGLNTTTTSASNNVVGLLNSLADNSINTAQPMDITASSIR